MKDPLAGFLLLLLVIAIIGGFIWLVIWMGKKRTQELYAIAQELKLQFFPKGDARIAPLLANLEFFHYGTNCKITNLMHGQIARGRKSVTVAIFDYLFMVGNNRTDTSINISDDSASIESTNDNDRECFIQTVIVFYDETIHIPAFNLRPENFMDKIGNVVGFQDINFVDFPVFSKRYRLDADRVDEVRDLFAPNLLKFYEGHKICTQANGSTVMIYPFGTGTGSQSVRNEQGKTSTASSYIAPKEIKSYLELGLRLLSLLERNLVQKSTV
jgi:hypothetical protein